MTTPSAIEGWLHRMATKHVDTAWATEDARLRAEVLAKIRSAIMDELAVDEIDDEQDLDAVQELAKRVVGAFVEWYGEALQERRHSLP